MEFLNITMILDFEKLKIGCLEVENKRVTADKKDLVSWFFECLMLEGLIAIHTHNQGISIIF